MIYCKRALALWLGLFFCFLFSPQAQENSAPVSGEISAQTGTLLVTDDGSSGFWRSGIALNVGDNLFLGFDLGRIYSSLPFIDGSVFGLTSQIGINTPVWGFNFTAGFFNHSSVKSSFDKAVFSNDGGQGKFFSFDVPLRFGSVSITPYIFYGNASWDDGDFYWFFGKPKLPSLFVYGTNVYLNQDDQYRHGLGFYGLTAKIKITSNENNPLFDAGIDSGLIYYRFLLEKKKTGFAATLGWLFANASLEGALTTVNQPYFLFPYLFYNANANLQAHAGFAFTNFWYSHSIFRYNINLGAVHVFYDHGSVNLHYQQKRLFGGKESSDKIDPDIKGMGAALIMLEASIPALPVGRQRLYLGLQKIFAISWGYDTLVSSFGIFDGGSNQFGTDAFSTLKAFLLSGLSIHGSLRW